MRSCELIGLLLLLFLTSAADAGIKQRPFSLHLGAGGIQPALNDSAQVWAFRPLGRIGFQYMLSPQTAFTVSGWAADIYNDTSSTSIFKTSKDDASQVWEVRALSVGPKFFLTRRKGTTPYLETRLDVLFWRVLNLPSEHFVKVENDAGGPINYTATELGITAGLGIEQLVAERLSLNAAFDFTYLSGIGTDFAQWVRNSRSRALMQLSLGVAYNFGVKKRTLRERYEEEMARRDENAVRTVYTGEIDEETGDTVFVDQSREPRGEFVPIARPSVYPEQDEDLDGVEDKSDKCPGTPSGALVDRDGCPNDADGDGVLDGIDLCEATPKAARAGVDRHGCPLDSDFDGVPDYRDECPGTVPAAEVDSVGCTPDRDGDGVDDNFDTCPDTPPGVAVDRRGCPDYDLVFAKRVVGSLFLPGDTKVTGDKRAVLDSVATLLGYFPEVSAVVSGYTDNLGPDEANLKLSRKRARAVLEYLIDRGVAATRLKAVGLGETNFIASNRTRMGREQNRRVEIEFTYSRPER